ncbi:MAG: hypothetical protein PHO56_03770 [Patescibacteria group bacterium]|nr:hypothetical protein [Patescibacteria group bacterium]
MKKKTILIWLVVILLIVIGVVVLKEHQSKKSYQKIGINQVNKIASSSPLINNQDNVASSSNSETTASSSSNLVYPTFAEINSVKINNNNWQTYKDKKYGFEISAPAGWSFSGKLDLLNGTELLIMPNSDGKFNAPTAIGILYDTSSPKVWLEKYHQEAKDKPEQIMEINIPTSDGAFVGLSHGIYGAYIRKGNEIFAFGAIDLTSNLLDQYAMMKAIIETFRFTK